MTRVDFYVVNGAAAHDLALCRVIEKAWSRGHFIFVCCESTAQAASFDDLLWRYKDTSFVPHRLESETDDGARIIVGLSPENAPEPDVLVNLAPEVPVSASSFARVVESAGYDDNTRDAARKRYRFYQERGFPLHTHKIGR